MKRKLHAMWQQFVLMTSQVLDESCACSWKNFTTAKVELTQKLLKISSKIILKSKQLNFL